MSEESEWLLDELDSRAATIDTLEGDLARAVYELLRIRRYTRQRKLANRLLKVRKHATSTAAAIIGRQPWLREAIEEMANE